LAAKTDTKLNEDAPGRGVVAWRERRNRTEVVGVRNAAQSIHLVAASAGFLSYLLLWVTIIWGMFLGRGWAMTRFKYANVYATHMTLAILAMTLGWGHAFTQLANPVGTVFLIDEFVPFANGRDPIGIGVGVVATEIMTALLISVPLQRRLGDRRWRALHSLAYASFTLLAGHVLLAGSDVGPLYVKIPVIALWLSTAVLWLGLAVWTRKGRKTPTDGAHGVRGGQRAQVQVDPGKCARFGFCEQEAPEVFELRGDGRLGYRSQVPAEQVEAAARAVKVCPARAITMRRVGSDARSRRPAETIGGEGDGSLAEVIDLRPR
jgi:sulfoxide reductase heme-binding subunit YedZ